MCIRDRYGTFEVGDETSNYKVKLDRFYSNSSAVAFNALRELNGALFTTYDRDNDDIPEYNAAKYYGGGFWYANQKNAECVLNAAKMSWFGLPLKKTRMVLECK